MTRPKIGLPHTAIQYTSALTSGHMSVFSTLIMCKVSLNAKEQFNFLGVPYTSLGFPWARSDLASCGCGLVVTSCLGWGETTDGSAIKTWVGFGNYIELLSDRRFATSLKDNVVWLVLYLLALPLGLVIALFFIMQKHFITGLTLGAVK